MKSNKITIYVCSILTFFSGIGMLLIEKFMHSESHTVVLQGISSGIFTGFIVSLVIAIIGYFHEKEVLVNKANQNINELYINMKIHSQILGNTLNQIHSQILGSALPKVHSSTTLEKLSLKNMSDLSKLNIEIVHQMDLSLFTPFKKKVIWHLFMND